MISAHWVRARTPALAALLLLSCGAPDERAPDLAIGSGWTRDIALGQSMAVVYLTVTNRGDGGDRLTGAESPAATAASLHSSSSSGGVARMRAIADGVEIPAHATIALKPGGTHIMLTGVKQRLSAGKTIDLTLAFARSGRRSMAVRIVPAGSALTEHGMPM